MSEITNTLVLLGLLVPMGAGALGIGDIRARSALNQNLSAEIPLVLSGSDSLDTLQIRLANPEAFARAGVERSQHLTRLRFKPIAKAGGEHVIQVSSSEVIQEPFLDFLVEVESPDGTLLREFTLLLDPPRGLSSASSTAYQNSETFGPTQASSDEMPVQAPRRQEVVAPPHRSENPSEAAPAAPLRHSAPAPGQLTHETYGPIRRGERLLEIAKRLQRPDSVTLEQMVVGLYLANPRSFRGNPNGLKAGSLLHIPTEDFLSQISTTEYGSMLRGTIAHAPNIGPGDSVFMPGEVSHVLPSKPERPAMTGPVAEVSARVASALKKENEELREQISHLEQRLEEAQRMLALKSAELAAFETRQAIQPSQGSDGRDTSAARLERTRPPEAVPNPPPSAQSPVAVPSPKTPSEPIAKRPIAAPPALTPTAVDQESPIAPGFLLASGGLILLGLGAWLYRRRVPHNGVGEPSSRVSLAGPPEPAMSQPPAPATGLSIPPVTPMSQPDSLVAEADILDPAWEADVYMRYGRYAQAETLIRESIKVDPGRPDLKLKLLEILHLADKAEAFLDYVRELQSSHAGLPPSFWATVRSMRPDLPPETETHAAIMAIELPGPPQSGGSSHDQMVETIRLSDVEDSDFSQELAELQAQHAQMVQREDRLTLEAQQGTFTAHEPAIPGGMTIGNVPGNLFSAELRELETQARMETSQTPGASTRQTVAIDRAETPQAELPDLGNLIEFELPPSRPVPEATETQKLYPSFDNLIPFDTSIVSSELPDLKTVPVTSDPGLTTASRDLIETELEHDPVKRDDPSTRRSGSPGALNFTLELLDPGEQASPLPQAEASSRKETTTADSCAALLVQAREFANHGDKAASRQLLQQVLQQGSPAERNEAETLMQELGKVRLSLVQPPTARKVS